MSLPPGLDGNWLRTSPWLAGLNLVDHNRRPLRESVYCGAIGAAVPLVETDLSIVINPVTIVAPDKRCRYDVGPTSAPNYQTKLRTRPVIEVTAFRLRWGNHPAAFEVPPQWIHLRSDRVGDVEIIDDGTTPLRTVFSGLVYNARGGFALKGRQPSLLEIEYRAGFEDEVPPEIAGLIGMKASIAILIAVGRGLAQGMSNRSVQQDGTNQSWSFAGGGAGVFKSDIDDLRKEYAQGVQTLRGKYTGIAIFGG